MNFKTGILKVAKTLLVTLLVGITVFIGIKLIISESIAINEYLFYESTDERGEINRVILTPNHKMMVMKTYQNIDEIGLYQITGKTATHFIAGLYCLGDFPLGLRYYFGAKNVYDTNLELVYKDGSSFPEVGETFKAKIIIYEDKSKIGTHSYQRVYFTDEMKETLKQLIDEFEAEIR